MKRRSFFIAAMFSLVWWTWVRGHNREHVPVSESDSIDDPTIEPRRKLKSDVRWASIGAVSAAIASFLSLYQVTAARYDADAQSRIRERNEVLMIIYAAQSFIIAEQSFQGKPVASVYYIGMLKEAQSLSERAIDFHAEDVQDFAAVELKRFIDVILISPETILSEKNEYIPNKPQNISSLAPIVNTIYEREKDRLAYMNAEDATWGRRALKEAFAPF